MKELLIVETRDAAEHHGPERMTELAEGMVQAGVPTGIFLTENAVFAVRGPAEGPFAGAMAGGVSVTADLFALNERGIEGEELHGGIETSDVDLIVRRLATGACVMWR
jgi:hypothetical protein